MTRIEFQNWLENFGFVETVQGRKYLEVYKIDDEESFGILSTALGWFWGANDWKVAFTLHNDKPKEVFTDPTANYNYVLHGDGSQTVTNGEVSYFVPPGRQAPELPRQEVMYGPLQSFRSLSSNITILTEFINSKLKPI